MKRLTEQQTEAVNHDDGNVAVVSVPGSGKTTVLVERARRLARENKGALLVLTFSRAAADEMNNRLGGQAMPADSFIGTFHSWSLQMLKKLDVYPYLDRSAILDAREDWRRIMWADKAVKYVNDGLDERAKADVVADEVLSTVTRLKLNGVHPTKWEELIEQQPTDGLASLMIAAVQYEQMKREAGRVTFEDMLVDVLHELSSRPTLARRLQEHYREVLVDEFQDVDPCQAQILQLITDNNLFAVGDEDQCHLAGDMIEVHVQENRELAMPVESIRPGMLVTTLKPTHDRHSDLSTAEAVINSGKVIGGLRKSVGAITNASENLYSGLILTLVSKAVRPNTRYLQLTPNHRLPLQLGGASRDFVYAVAVVRTAGRYQVELLKLAFGDINRRHVSSNWIRIWKDVRDNKSVAWLVCGDPSQATVLGFAKHLQEKYPDELDFHPELARTLADPTTHNVFAARQDKAADILLFEERLKSAPLISRHQLGDTIVDEGITEETVLKKLVLPGRAIQIVDCLVQPVTSSQLVSYYGIRSGPLWLSVSRARDVPVYSLELDDKYYTTCNGVVLHNSIYQFRHCDPKFLLDFESHFGPYRRITVDQNFRSVPAVIGRANSLIEQNDQRHDKRIQATRAEGGEVQCVQTAKQRDVLLASVNYATKNLGYQYRDIAVLYRTNAESALAEEAFAGGGIPFYNAVNREGFFGLRAVSPLIDYLSLAVNLKDLGALTRIVNRPTRFIKGEHVRSAIRDHDSLDPDALEVLDSVFELTRGSNIRKNIRALQDVLHRLSRENTTGASPSQLLALVLAEMPYEAWLIEQYKKKAITIADDDALRAVRVLEEKVLPEYTATRGFLDHVARTKAELLRRNESTDAVQLMTIHRSKGREWPMVIVMNANEGMLPHENSEVDEERRLMYVAITRAQNYLIVTAEGGIPPSPFLKEMGYTFSSNVRLNEITEKQETTEDETTVPDDFSLGGNVLVQGQKAGQ